MQGRLRRGSPGRRLARGAAARPGSIPLDDGARIGVVGGGPAGSFFSFFLLRMAATAGLRLTVEIYEPRRFDQPGAVGCNHCGGVLSESLIQILATEGIVLPNRALRRGIDGYVLHTDVGSAKLSAPAEEKRIAAVYRGSGPRLRVPLEIASFDGFLLDLASARGASVIRDSVESVTSVDGRPSLVTKSGERRDYDLIAVTAGVNGAFLETVRRAFPTYGPPKVARTAICEYLLGAEEVDARLGNAMHVFLLDMPGLEFAALIPKGELATLCLLGDGMDQDFVRAFLAVPAVQRLLGGSAEMKPACMCFPYINVGAATRPWADRLVALGDAGTARLYKDGIGAAYRTAKSAASTAVFQGVGEPDFRAHYAPTLRRIQRDNALGRIVFTVAGVVQRSRAARRGLVRMVREEQASEQGSRTMSQVLWDMFTGSAPYSEVFLSTLRPSFGARLAWNLLAANAARPAPAEPAGVVGGRDAG